MICSFLESFVEGIFVEEVLEFLAHHGGSSASQVRLEALQQLLTECPRLQVLAQETQTPVEADDSYA